MRFDEPGINSFCSQTREGWIEPFNVAYLKGDFTRACQLYDGICLTSRQHKRLFAKHMAAMPNNIADNREMGGGRHYHRDGGALGQEFLGARESPNLELPGDLLRTTLVNIEKPHQISFG